jgi:type II secretory pathway pseudopilin PulG
LSGGTARPRRARHRPGRSAAGSSLAELVVAAGLAASVAAMALPGVGATRGRHRAAAAARHTAAVMQTARAEAVRTGRTVAVRFVDEDRSVVMRRYLDGNRNGVRTSEIVRGTDRPVGLAVSIGQQFPGTEFGLIPGVIDAETGAAVAGDGVKVGTSRLLSFSPQGTSSSGTIYVRSGDRWQYAVRVLGGTGRIRVLRFDTADRTWSPP